MGYFLLGTLWTIAALFVLFLVFWKFIFLRDPERKAPRGNNIVSPADGRVINVTKFTLDKLKVKKGYLGKIRTLTSDVGNPGYAISIFMSPFDVHVNRAPVSGEIIYSRHTKGTFHNAKNPEKSLSNEKNEILIKAKFGFVKVIQIAGFVARRIEAWVQERDRVTKGQKIGRINLGSQVTMILPKKAKIRIKRGQRVSAGETIIAEY